MPWRDDGVATATGRSPYFCFSLCGPSFGFCSWLECEYNVAASPYMGTGFDNVLILTPQAWYGYTITICIELSAASVVISYWNDTINVSQQMREGP